MKKIYVDGCMNRHTGESAWSSVTDEKGKDLIDEYKHLLTEFELTKVPLNNKVKKGEYTIVPVKFEGVKHQNNGAELVAMLIGLKIALHLLPEPCEVYSDSTTVIAWSEGRVTSKTYSEMDPKKKLLVNELKDLAKDLKSIGGKIKKVDGGKNPADLGFHK
jgi:ribonuclease HI